MAAQAPLTTPAANPTCIAGPRRCWHDARARLQDACAAPAPACAGPPIADPLLLRLLLLLLLMGILGWCMPLLLTVVAGRAGEGR